MRSITPNLRETYEAEPASVGRARRDIAGFATAAGASVAQIDDVRLAVSEAVTNAIVHGYRGAAGHIRMIAHVDAGELWVVISDDGCGLRPRTDRPGLGLGLGLIARISDHMTIVTPPAGGTELRMRFDLSVDAEDAIGASRGSVGIESEMASAVASPSRT